MDIEFKQKDLLGGWAIEVSRNGVVLGHVRKHGQKGTFLYYSGPHNVLNHSFEETDLESLKKQLASSL